MSELYGVADQPTRLAVLGGMQIREAKIQWKGEYVDGSGVSYSGLHLFSVAVTETGRAHISWLTGEAQWVPFNKEGNVGLLSAIFSTCSIKPKGQ